MFTLMRKKERRSRDISMPQVNVCQIEVKSLPTTMQIFSNFYAFVFEIGVNNVEIKEKYEPNLPNCA